MFCCCNLPHDIAAQRRDDYPFNSITQKAVGLCQQKKTKKLCYRKDDRAMRPIYECPETLKAEPS